MKFRDRRALEAEIRATRVAATKMERVLDEQYEHLRKLEMELENAHYQPVDSQGP
jgi:hypothetical protein